MHTENMHRVPIRVLVLSLFAFTLSAQQSIAQTSWPTQPPARICGNSELLSGPATPPSGAIVVPAGNNNDTNWNQPGATFWFAPGVHTFNDGPYANIVPGHDTTFIGAPGAVLDGRNLNLFAFTQHARNVTIRYLEIRNFGTGTDNNDQGVVNHDSGENWTIEYNYVHDNDGAGVMIGSGNKIRYNCLEDNGQYGFNAYHEDGVRDVVLDHNEVTGNNQDDWEKVREGCGCTGGGKFWDTRGAVVTNNWVHDNRGTGLWADFNNSEFLFEGNYIENNDGMGLFYEISYNFVIRNNTFKRNAIVTGKPRAERGDPFPFGAIYISESGGDARAGAQYVQAEISGNYFENNWDGIVLWENADRFCRPEEASDTTNNCPFFERTWGTRFRTQNISIHDNEFRVDKAAIGCTNTLCARMGLFSQYGTHPANSPYLGTVIQHAITFDQNNLWSRNAYHGPWRFVPFGTDRNISFATWQAGPYNQDAGSTFDGDMGPPSTSPPGPGTPPANPPANFLDVDTSTLEGSAGKWTASYAATAAQSAEQAHGGARSLRIDVMQPNGWGMQLSTGFSATAGTKTVSVWGKLGAGADVRPTVMITWLDADQATLEEDVVRLSALTTQWAQTKAMVEAPYGTRTVLVSITGNESAETVLYLDDIVVGDVDNALDAGTANLEGSLGKWEAWYGSSISRATDRAYSGTSSLLIELAGGGWAVHLSAWPGFAVTPGTKRVSYWAKGGTGNVAGVTLRAKWFDASGQVIQTDLVPLSTLTMEWQQAVLDVLAPADTTDVRVELYSGSGSAGSTVYVDNVVIMPLP